jgi:hypothetical protein
MTKELEEAKARLSAVLRDHERNPQAGTLYLIAADLRTLLSALSRGDGWEPIETAPKDGTVIFGMAHYDWFPAAIAWCRPNENFDDGSHPGLPAGEPPQWVYADYSLHKKVGPRGNRECDSFGPEYWMPLPKEPPPHDFAADHAETILRAYAAPPVPEGEESKENKILVHTEEPDGPRLGASSAPLRGEE